MFTPQQPTNNEVLCRQSPAKAPFLSPSPTKKIPFPRCAPQAGEIGKEVDPMIVESPAPSAPFLIFSFFDTLTILDDPSPLAASKPVLMQSIPEIIATARDNGQWKPHELVSNFDCLAVAACRQSCWQGALDAWIEALHQRGGAAPADNINIARTVNNIGVGLIGLRRHEDAVYALEQAAKLQKDMLQRHTRQIQCDFAGTLHNLGIAFSLMQQHAQAISNFQSVCEVLQLHGANQHPRALAAALRQLGRTLAIAGLYSDAWEALNEARSILIYRCHMEPSHPWLTLVRREISVVEDVLATHIELSFSFE